jgi:hypothetical protein
MKELATPFTLYPSKKKISLLFLGSALFVAGGVFLIHRGDTGGWYCTVFFGACLVVSLFQFLPGSAYLTVDDQGIEVCALFRKSRIDWADIAEFGVYSMRNHGIAVSKMVGINFSDHYSSKSKTGRATARVLTGFDGGLPDTYGLKAEDLALLLSNYNERYKSKSA